VQELEAQLKAQQVYEQSNGQAVWSLGAAFWELRFPKGWNRPGYLHLWPWR
jgi:hypothetical protein